MKLAEAILKASLVQEMLALKLDPRLAALTLNEWFFKYYLPSIKQTNKSWKSDLQRYTTHISPVIGQLAISEISEIHLNRLINGLRPSSQCRRGINKLANSSVNRVIALLKVMFNKLSEEGYLHRNVARVLKLRKERNIRATVLRPEEYARFFEALRNQPKLIRHLVLSLLLLGWRIGEAISAKWDWFDFERRIIRLPDSKSGRPRVIYVSDEALTVLKELYALKSNEFMFPGVRGGHISYPSRQFKVLTTEAGLDGFWIHDLRRTFATCAAQAFPAYAVSRLLGHSNTQITERYLVVTDDTLQAAVASVGQRFSTQIETLTSPTTSSHAVNQPIILGE